MYLKFNGLDSIELLPPDEVIVGVT